MNLKDFCARLQLKSPKKRIDIVKRITLTKVVNGISIPVISVFEDYGNFYPYQRQSCAY